MRIQEIHERSIPLSRYAGVAAAAGGLSTSLVAVRTDVMRDGRRVVGYGHASVGRYAQGGLIRERFAPRLLAAPADSLLGDDGGIDPFRAWSVMMRDEKPGGHGERCVAVGALDMALWDAAAKAAGLPMHRFLARRLGLAQDYPRRVPVYASGGYPYPHDDLARLEEELRRFVDLGYTHAKIKIGAAGLDRDLRRIDTALRVLGDASRLAVDAMNRYDAGAPSTQRKPWRRWGCGGSRTSAIPTTFPPRPRWRLSTRGPSLLARPCSLWPRRACSMPTAACGGSVTCCCSTPCIATVCRVTWRYSTRSAPVAGRARPSVRTPGNCSACIWWRPCAWAGRRLRRRLSGHSTISPVPCRFPRDWRDCHNRLVSASSVRRHLPGCSASFWRPRER